METPPRSPSPPPTSSTRPPSPSLLPGDRVRTLDVFKIVLLLCSPLLLSITYWAPLRSTAPSREELRDVLRSLDESAYRGSGCDEVKQMLERCEVAKCPSMYMYDLRTLNRNCRAIRCAAARRRPRALTARVHAHQLRARPLTPPPLRSH